MVTAAALGTILAASLAGSVHCVAMCGPLVGLAGGARTLRLALVHSLGRLATYVSIGAVAGAIGGAIDLAGHLANVQRAATLVAGLAIIAWGVAALVRSRRAGSVAAAARTSPFARALVQIRRRRPTARAWLAGVLTGLLPCGWLWAFAISAGGTGRATSGALVMLAFWLGTVPAMLGVLAFAGPALARLRARVPAITALALVALGLATLALRWHAAGVAHCRLCAGGL